MGLGRWRRKRDSSITEVAVERVETEVHGEQRHDRILMSSYLKVVDHRDRPDLSW